MEIRFFNGSVSLWVERDGKMTFENAIHIPEDYYLTGLNFSSSGKIMLDDLKVEDFNSSESIIP